VALNYIDLFSGIGGFALGAYWAGMKFDNHYFSEVEPFAVELYQKRFPDAIPLGDIREIDCEQIMADAESIRGGGVLRRGGECNCPSNSRAAIQADQGHNRHDRVDRATPTWYIYISIRVAPGEGRAICQASCPVQPAGVLSGCLANRFFTSEGVTRWEFWVLVYWSY